MKTNQIMIRDNELFIQRTSDGYFNANVLARSKGKIVSDYKKNSSSKEFIEQLKREGIKKPLISSAKGTWMHPKLYIDFAMWVSVEFKSIVIDYILDGLIKSRHEAGDYFNEMSATILGTYTDYYKRKPPPTIYQSEARRIKRLLGIKKSRNELSEKELNMITNLQKMNTVLIKMRTGKVARVKQLTIYAEGLKL